jgi:hypothetical protein
LCTRPGEAVSRGVELFGEATYFLVMLAFEFPKGTNRQADRLGPVKPGLKPDTTYK